jgi:hypothetical protein
VEKQTGLHGATGSFYIMAQQLLQTASSAAIYNELFGVVALLGFERIEAIE